MHQFSQLVFLAVYANVTFLVTCFAISDATALAPSSLNPACNSTKLNTLRPCDEFYRSIAGAVAIATRFNPAARSIYICAQLSSRIPKIDVVFTAYETDLIMTLNGNSWTSWSLPEDLPQHYPMPQGLRYFVWSRISMGLTEATGLIEAQGIHKRWRTVSVMWEDEPTQQVYYHFYDPRGGPYSFVRVGTQTKEVIVEPVASHVLGSNLSTS
ncbi:MAG: hypothetical protein Q9217_000400 [Psora testacea]